MGEIRSARITEWQRHRTHYIGSRPSQANLPCPRRRWNVFSEHVYRLRKPIHPAAMFDFVVYLLYRAGSAVVAALPLPFLFGFGQFLGVCVWMFSGKYRRLATRNLAIAFANEKTPCELRQLVRRHFRQLGANLLCSAKLTQMPA